MLQSFDLPSHYDALHPDRRAKPRVLVVDDTESQRYAIVRALRNEGFEVAEAESGAQALEIAGRTPFDAVVLDVHLPDMDGFEICRRLKAASTVLLPVLHLSSTSTTAEARTFGLDAGADGYLTHPFDPNVLRAAVSSLVRLKRQESERLAQVAATSLLQEALDTLAEHIALLDSAGNVIGVNESWARFAAANDYAGGGTGLGANYCDVCERASGDDAAEARAAAAGIRGVLAGTDEQFEMDYPCSSPEVERWYRLTVRRVARPGPVAAIVTHSDRTAEHARVESDARFRRFVETTHEGVVAMDLVGTITYANPRAEKLLGYSPVELVGRSFLDFLPPDEALAARTRMANRQRGGSDGVPMQVQRRDGTMVEFIAAESPIVDSSGNVTGVLAMLADVTAGNHAARATAEALRTADLDRRRLEATLDAIPVGVWLSDAHGALTHTNPAAVRIWGGNIPSIGGVEEYDRYRGWWPDTGAVVAAEEWALARTLRTGDTITDEMAEIQRFDGTRGFVLCSAAPIFGADAAMNGAVVVYIDITERHDAARERERLVASLGRERTHLAAVFEQAPAFLAVGRGPHHVFDRVNPAYLELMGPREMIGKSAAEALPELVDQGLIQLLDHVRETGKPFIGQQMPVRLARVAGAPLETRYLDLVYQRLDDPEGDHAIVAHGVDVTEQVLAVERLRRSEQRLREQFAKLPVPTYLWEQQGDDFVLRERNDAAAQLFGMFADTIVGAQPGGIHRGSETVSADMRRCLADNVVLRCTVELRAGPLAPPRRCDLTIGPQQPHCVLVHVADVTERSELEAQLRQAQKMEAVGRLAGGVAHDFNNLLTVIGAHSTFLLESLDASDPQREDAKAIHMAGVRAAGLTRQLLAFSRKQILKPQVIDLDATVEETRQMLERLLGEDIQIVMRTVDALPRVVADRGQIDQVLVNLAVNARDAMPGGGRLTMATSRVTITDDALGERRIIPAGDYVVLSVSDTGQGMSTQVQARLFEPFFTTKEAGKGTGLGLATVYGIVKQSNGYITVESVPGEGTTFEIFLPAVSAGEQDDQLRIAERAAARGVETVLLVEDEAAIRAVAKRMLRRQGYVVLEADNGQAALALAATFDSTIHLVVSDAVMPGMGGVDVVRRLQAQRPGLKALFMSGYTSDEITRRGIVTASMRFVQKPFSSIDFTRAVREALDS